MKVELNRDVNYLMTRGNKYEAEEVAGGMVRIKFSSDMLVPASFVRRVQFIVHGVDLLEGQHYDVEVQTYGGRKSGKTQMLRGYRLTGIAEHGWREGFRVTFTKVSGKWGGPSRTVDHDRVVSIMPVAGPKVEED